MRQSAFSSSHDIAEGSAAGSEGGPQERSGGDEDSLSGESLDGLTQGDLVSCANFGLQLFSSSLFMYLLKSLSSINFSFRTLFSFIKCHPFVVVWQNRVPSGKDETETVEICHGNLLLSTGAY